MEALILIVAIICVSNFFSYLERKKHEEQSRIKRLEYQNKLANWLRDNQTLLINKSKKLQAEGKKCIEDCKQELLNSARNDLKLYSKCLNKYFSHKYYYPYGYYDYQDIGTKDISIPNFDFYYESDTKDIFHQFNLDEYIIYRSHSATPYLKGYCQSSKDIIKDIRKDLIAAALSNTRDCWQQLLNTAQNDLKLFLKNYYEVYQDFKTIGNDLNSFLNSCHQDFKAVVTYHIPSTIDEKLEHAVLNNNERFNINDIFINKELDLDSFRDGTYVTYGPFHWLRESGFLSPQKIRAHGRKRFQHNNKTSNIITEKDSLSFSQKMESDNLQPITPKELNNIISNPLSTNIGSHPGVQKNNNHPYLEDKFLQKKQKLSSTPTYIYILKSPFKTDQGWLIKVGESTNLKHRIRTYQFFWRNHFEIICCIKGIVSDEIEILNALKKYHFSGEYFNLPEDVIEKIVRIGNPTIQDLLLIA